MLTIISPSKTQRVKRLDGVSHLQPFRPEKTAALAQYLRQLSENELSTQLGVSAALASKIAAGYQRFSLPHHPQSAGTALASFSGDVFTALHPERYSRDELLFAERHLRIISGLYGILTPLTLMQPYRLEMATRLAPAAMNNLYAYWQDDVNAALNTILKDHAVKVIVNCASQEYARIIDRHRLAGQLLTISFRQRQGGITKTVAIHAKRARGLFIDWLIVNRIDQPEHLVEFNRDNYRHAANESLPGTIVFIREL